MTELRCLARLEIPDREVFEESELAGRAHDEPYFDAMTVEELLSELEDSPGWIVEWIDDNTLELTCDQEHEPEDDGVSLLQAGSLVELVNDDLDGAAYIYFMHCTIAFDEVTMNHIRADGEDGGDEDEPPLEPSEVWERYDANGASWPVAED